MDLLIEFYFSNLINKYFMILIIKYLLLLSAYTYSILSLLYYQGFKENELLILELIQGKLILLFS